MSHGKIKFIIFKISDDKKEIVLDEVSEDQDYEAFRTKLDESRDNKGNPTPRYAVYDVAYEIPGEGKRYVEFLGDLLDSELTPSQEQDHLHLLGPHRDPYLRMLLPFLYALTPLLIRTVVHDLRQHPREPEERAQHPHLPPRRRQSRH